MNWFSNAISSISNVLENCVKAVATIGPALAAYSTKVVPVLGQVMLALQVATAVVKFADALLKVTGVINSNEGVEEIGERSLQAAEQGITLDKFDDFDAYMDKLRNFELDPDVASKRNLGEKLLAGLGVTTVGIEQKFNAEPGSLGGLWALPIAHPAYFTPERVQDFLSTGRLVGDILGYLQGELSGGEARSFEKRLETGADGKPFDVQEREKLYDALDSSRANWADILREAQETSNSQGN